MKKTICTGLTILLLATGSVKPKSEEHSKSGIVTAMTTTAAYPFKKTAALVKHAGYSIKEAACTAKNMVIGSAKTMKHLILTGIESTQLALYLMAIVTAAYGLDAALLYATKIGFPKSLFNTYEFGTIYTQITPIINKTIESCPKIIECITEILQNPVKKIGMVKLAVCNGQQ